MLLKINSGGVIIPAILPQYKTKAYASTPQYCSLHVPSNDPVLSSLCSILFSFLFLTFFPFSLSILAICILFSLSLLTFSALYSHAVFQ